MSNGFARDITFPTHTDKKSDPPTNTWKSYAHHFSVVDSFALRHVTFPIVLPSPFQNESVRDQNTRERERERFCDERRSGRWFSGGGRRTTMAEGGGGMNSLPSRGANDLRQHELELLPSSTSSPVTQTTTRSLASRLHDALRIVADDRGGLDTEAEVVRGSSQRRAMATAVEEDQGHHARARTSSVNLSLRGLYEMLGSSSRVGEGPVGTVAEGVEGNAHGVQGLDFSVSADGVPELAHEPSRLGGGAYQRRQSRDQGAGGFLGGGGVVGGWVAVLGGGAGGGGGGGGGGHCPSRLQVRHERRPAVA